MSYKKTKKSDFSKKADAKMHIKHVLYWVTIRESGTGIEVYDLLPRKS